MIPSRLTIRRLALAIMAVDTSLLACASVPHQELSEARRLQAADAAGARSFSEFRRSNRETNWASRRFSSTRLKDSRREALRAKQSALEVMAVAKSLITVRKDLSVASVPLTAWR